MDASTWEIKKIPASQYRATQREIEQTVANMADIIADTTLNESFFSDDATNDDEAAGAKGEVVDV